MNIKEQINNVIKTIKAQLQKAEAEERNYKGYMLDREEAISTLEAVLREEEVNHETKH